MIPHATMPNAAISEALTVGSPSRRFGNSGGPTTGGEFRRQEPRRGGSGAARGGGGDRCGGELPPSGGIWGAKTKGVDVGDDTCVDNYGAVAGLSFSASRGGAILFLLLLLLLPPPPVAGLVTPDGDRGPKMGDCQRAPACRYRFRMQERL